MSLLSDFTGFFFPRCCVACAGYLVRGETAVCTRCISDFPKTGYHEYPENPIERRLAGRLPIEHGWAFLKFRKQGIVQNLLHQLKYNNRPEIGLLLGQIYGSDLSTAGFTNEFDLIIPVPLHAARKKQRGYNQSALFAAGLSSALSVPWSEAVSMRTVTTETQTKKSKIERWENVKNVFSIAGGEVKGKRILLVDDVMTTGATLEACGTPIIQGGCASLSIACIAEAQ